MTPANTAKFDSNGRWHPWQTLSVQEFFSTVNWNNDTVQTMPLPIVKAGARSVNHGITVNEFFNAIPWEHEALIVAPSRQDINIPAKDGTEDFNLDDFFGSF